MTEGSGANPAKVSDASPRMTDGSRLPSVLLRALTHDDRALVRKWLPDALIRAWWGPPSAMEAEIAIALESATAICRMIEADGAAVGYASAYDAGLMDRADAPGGEPGIWHCTFFIGAEPQRGRGLGTLALDLLVREVLSTTLAIACETRVPVRNERAVRQIEAIGFRWHRIESDAALGPFWIMRRDRTI